MIISKEYNIVLTPIFHGHTVLWVKKTSINIQQWENITDLQRETIGNTYIIKLELNDLDTE